MLPRDPRELTREEMGRRLCEVLAAQEAERDRMNEERKRSRERLADLKATEKGIRDFLSGKRGAQVPLTLVDRGPSDG